jgi:hypothetical protein
MPNISSPCTWEMSAAQIISPTTSQVALVNALQASVVASTNWVVNATGTSTAGFKYVEIKPANTQSLYKDYRILIVERVNTATNKTLSTSDGGSFNSTGFVYLLFSPDGGSAHVTPTFSNIETSSDVYVGSRYKSGTSSVWLTLPVPCTATWLYLCDGALWIVDRVGAASHTLLGVGQVQTLTGFTDYNTGGAEVGVPTFFTRAGLTSATMITQVMNTGAQAFWHGSGSTSRTFVTLTGGSNARLFGTDSNASSNYFLSSKALPATGANISAMSFPPVAYWYNWSAGSGGQSVVVLRGVHFGFGQKTRTTIQSDGTTVGFTFYPDDAASGSALATLCFLNT